MTVPRPRGEAMRRVDREIAAEKVAALGRAGERLERALGEAHVVASRLLGVHAADRARLAEEYAAARGRALDARLALLIQREALGLRRHATVDQQFPEPPTLEMLLRENRRTGTDLTANRSDLG